MIKRITLFLTILFLLAFGATAMAAPANSYAGFDQDDVVVYDFSQTQFLSDMTPRFTYISSIAAGLDISAKGVANFFGDCDTYTNCNITVTAELQQKVSGTWKTIKTISDSAYDKYCWTSYSCSVPSGYQFQVKSTVKANGETATVYSNIEIY